METYWLIGKIGEISGGGGSYMPPPPQQQGRVNAGGMNQPSDSGPVNHHQADKDTVNQQPTGNGATNSQADDGAAVEDS
jgi:hypothetical protein